ncbi:subtilase family protein [Dongia mobilis]|uniref:Subtilase family protein n=1 Tax=Dongia mobilis TaxID=578943 RepID=A0A4R6WV75_9PROT|nr:S8 family serine peptidase [Dongia mobilis]TDQ81009.1 subtilase family protein [Dongia mobilis]
MRPFLIFAGLLALVVATMSPPALAQSTLPATPPRIPTQPDLPGSRGDMGPTPSIPDLFDAADGAGSDGEATPGNRPPAVPNELCVIFPPNAASEAAQTFADDIDLEIVRDFTMQGLGLRVYLMRLGDGAEPDQVFEAAAADQRPVWVQPNFIYRTTQDPAGATGDQQYALRQMRADIAAPQAGGGEGIRIALIDSGVDTAHESLAGATISAFDLVDDGSVAAEVHGTVLASIMVGQGPLHGIAPRAELIAIRAFREVEAKQGLAESSSFLLSLGIETAIRQQARIANLSLTGPQDRLVSQLVGEALLNKVSVVAAAGNAGPKAAPAYPAAQDGVIAVTATDMKDRLFKDANRGDYISVAAPGVDILGARPGGGYDFFSGTSMATGYASGLAALLLSHQPALGVVKLRRAMEESAIDLGAPQRDPEFGAGRIDALAALERLP